MKFVILTFLSLILALKIISSPWSIAKTDSVVGAHMSIIKNKNLFIFILINLILYKILLYRHIYEFDEVAYREIDNKRLLDEKIWTR